jgi:hypothetical protein
MKALAAKHPPDAPDEQPVEDDEADGPCADPVNAANGPSVGTAGMRVLGARLRLGRETAEYHQVVDRGVVIVRGMGAVAEVLDVQVEDGRAAQFLRGRWSRAISASSDSRST